VYEVLEVPTAVTGLGVSTFVVFRFSTTTNTNVVLAAAASRTSAQAIADKFNATA